MHAYANPTPENYNAAGYGLIRFNKSTRKITMECWPRHVDVKSPTAKQFPGWPVTIDQLDNYGRDAIAVLPAMKIDGPPNPVVQVIDEYLDEVVYTLRIKGNRFCPKVFKEGIYTILVGEGDRQVEFNGIGSVAEDADIMMGVHMPTADAEP